MIGQKELRAAANDVIASGGNNLADTDPIEAAARATSSAGLDYWAAHVLALEAAEMAERINGSFSEKFRAIFFEALLIGIRCGRADAAKTASEMVSSKPKGISGYE